MADVFISYKRRLRPRVQQLAAALSELGVEVWFDAELEPGQTFSGEISQELRAAKCVLVCWSNDAFPHGGDENGWVVGEATIGRNRKVLVAITLEATDFDPPWNIVHSEDFSNWDQHQSLVGRPEWQNVLVAIGRFIGRPGLVEYDRARSVGTTRALRQWIKAYPDDPLVPIARRASNARSRPAKAKSAKAVGPQVDVETATDVAPASIGEVTSVVSASLPMATEAPEQPIGEMQAAIDVTAIERALAEPSPSRENESNLETADWLERDAALTADLSFERQRLEEAVASALEIQEVAATERVGSVVIPEVSPETVSVASQFDALAEARAPTPRQMLISSIAGVLVSSGPFFAAVHWGLTNTPLGNIVAVVACPALYGLSIAIPGLANGRINLLRAALLTLVVPALAVCSGAVALLAYAFVPKSIGDAVYGAAGSLVGSFVLLNVLVASGAIKERGWLATLLLSLIVAAVPTIFELSPHLGINTTSDAAWTMFAWEIGFSLALVVLSVPFSPSDGSVEPYESRK